MITTMNSKPWFQKRLRPTARLLADAGVTANQVTLATMGVSLATGITVLLNLDSAVILWLIPGALLVRLANNHIDGLLAKSTA